MILGLDTGVLVAWTMAGSPRHEKVARLLASEAGERGTLLGLTSQVLDELLHVVIDPKRFENPLPMSGALRIARALWEAEEVVPLLPTPEVLPRTLELMAEAQALELAKLAHRVAELMWGEPAWCSRTEGYTLVFLSSAWRVANNMKEAENAFARALALWEAGAKAAPDLLPEWHFLERLGTGPEPRFEPTRGLAKRRQPAFERSPALFEPCPRLFERSPPDF